MDAHVLLTLSGAVLLHQLGAPIPALPFLIWAGAAAGGDAALLAQSFALATLLGTLGNAPWYWAGRRYGYRVLRVVCRVTISPDSCVRRTESAFERRGPAMLVFARLLPGLGAVAAPLAGAFGVGTATFVRYDLLGSALRAAVGLALGMVFHDEVDWLLEQLATLGGHAMLAVGLLLAAYVAYRLAQRWLFLRSLRMARIDAFELAEMMRRGDDPVVLDVRTRSHRLADGRQIPGAHAVDLDALESTLAEVPRGREVVVYCACPNEATAARVALQLRARGFQRVRPLTGGIDAWVSAGHAFDRIGARE